MGRLGVVCCAVSLALCRRADAGDVWKSIEPVEAVTVRIHWVSVAELETAARAVGKRSADRPLGFSVLRKNVATDGYVCDIYLPQRPERVDDRSTVSLGHEMAHCLGFSHERAGPPGK
jgi:hypothetical protein